MAVIHADTPITQFPGVGEARARKLQDRKSVV